MSQSPDSSEVPSDAAAAYKGAWSAINRLIRKGHSWSGHERNCAFLNLGEGRFADASHATGFAFADDARALGLVDVDLDGRVDLLVTNRTTPRARLMRGAGSARSLLLHLRGTGANRQAIGARVEVVTGMGDSERTLVRAVRAGEGYLSQSSPWLAFGLNGASVERVVVHWPAGEREEFNHWDANDGTGTFVLEQGAGRPSLFTREPARHPAVGRAVPVDEDASASREAGEASDAGPKYGKRVVLGAPLPLPSLAVFPIDGAAITLFGVKPGGAGTGTGRPVLLNLWSSDCVPCVGELTEFAERADDLNEAGVAFLALNVDIDVETGAELDAAKATMERVGWPYAWAAMAPESIEILDVLLSVVRDSGLRLPLPTSFLIDANGNLRVIYTGRVAPDQMLRDVKRMNTPASEWLDYAHPFGGTWRHVPALGLPALEGRFAARGLDDAAREYSRTAFEVATTSRAAILHGFGREYAADGKFVAAMDAFRRAALEDPDFFLAPFDLAVLLQRDGEPHEAIAAYLRALEIRPDDIDTHFNLAIAYLETRQLPSAERHHARLVDLGSPLAGDLVPFLKKLRQESAER